MRIALLILLSVIGLWAFQSFPVSAVVCAPGDIAVDANGNRIEPQPSYPTDSQGCLYGTGSVPSAFGKPVQDVQSNIRIALNVLFGFLSVIVIIMVLYGGITWLTAMGQEEKVNKGRDTLVWAAIGAVVITVAWTITSYILHSAAVIGS